MRYETEERREGAVDYEPPALSVLGAAETVTLGPNGGPLSDSVFPHHSSGG
ncbi:MAG TPA: lasso RiPP family leader peptide-containing protein [Gaiellaceae bacterium]|nr:lasso RiPP family leader peptide-containing protein [Gaiellaceae bacterium]